MAKPHLVDYAILSFKTEEFDALLARFVEPLHVPVRAPRRNYTFRLMRTAGGRPARVALVRTVTQGLGDAQNATTDIIEDLNPRMFVVAGIAGGKPGEDVFLGDVVLATHIHDFSLQAHTPNGPQLATAGYPVHRQVGAVIAALPSWRRELGLWDSEEEVAYPRPAVRELNLSGVGGPREWRTRIRQAVQYHADRVQPSFVDGSIASSDDLIKTAESMRLRLDVDRRILAAEMESAGVARACQRSDGEIPLLVVRGISDFPELPRCRNYDVYACNVAASFTKAIVRLDVVERLDASSPETATPPQLADLVGLGGALVDPVPVSVLMRSFDTEPAAFEQLVQQSSGSLELVGDSRDYVVFHDRDRQPKSEFTLPTLYQLLNFIEIHAGSGAGIGQCRNALGLFLLLDLPSRQLVAQRLFDVLDKPMKALGNKRLVVRVAEACIEATSHESRSPGEAECEARARICGLSWAYQRMGDLDLAADEAEKSLEVSRHLNLRTNLAFCIKCKGRLERMRAEMDDDTRNSRAKFSESVRLLTEAVDAFSAHEDFGPEHEEVGDCLSLLGRTCLAMGDVNRALHFAERASDLLVDELSKDFLDLAILKGDIAFAQGNVAEAHAQYRQVIGAAHRDDYPRSEIVARALHSRARLYVRTTDLDKAGLDFENAADIWDTYEEPESAGQARWDGYRAKLYLPSPLLHLLEDEASFAVRADACRRYVEGAEQARGAARSRRHRPDTQIMRRCLKAAREDHALRRQPELF